MIYISDNVKKKLKFYTIILVIAIAIAFAIFTVMKYEVEGEKEVPFEVGKMFIISSTVISDDSNELSEESTKDVEQESEGLEQQENEENAENNEETESNEEENYIWNERVIQTNDVYIYLDKNKSFKEEQSIKNVKIDNIKILEKAKVGKIQVYMPNSLDDGQYKYTDDFLVGSSLNYRGAEADNKKALEIGYQGGGIYISFANVGLENYKSNEGEELQQGGFILEKMNVSDDDLKFKVSFDLIIEVQDKSYVTNIVLDMPAGELVGHEEAHKEITDFGNLVFKRMQ